MSPPTRSRRRLLQAVAGPLTVLVLVCPAAAQPEPAAAGAQGFATSEPAAAKAIQPTLLPGFSSAERWHLTAAFTRAAQKLESERCQALFAGLALDPLPALVGTLYEPARGALAAAYCRRHAVALTAVSGTRTRLCDPFHRLSLNDQAVTLIHEALHRAGLGESPPDPTAPTAREISARVRAACDL